MKETQHDFGLVDYVQAIDKRMDEVGEPVHDEPQERRPCACATGICVGQFLNNTAYKCRFECRPDDRPLYHPLTYRATPADGNVIEKGGGSPMKVHMKADYGNGKVVDHGVTTLEEASRHAVTSGAKVDVVGLPRTTLPIDSDARKRIPLLRGCFRYFPAALAGVAKWSQTGNDKHNPGQDLHHARGKSSDHGDCILRHLMDIQDYLAQIESGRTSVPASAVLDELNALCWRALALSQELHEKLAGAPLAPSAKLY